MLDREPVAGVWTVERLGELLRWLRRRRAHRRGEAELTYRELAARTGWSLGTVAGRPLT